MTKPGSICECGCGGALPPKSGQGRPRKYLDGHSPSQKAAAEAKSTLGDGTTIVSKTCKCGCNETFTTDKARQQYIDGHSPTARMLAANAEAKANAPATPGICACGCGEALPVQTGKGARRLYIEGHRAVTVATPKKDDTSTKSEAPEPVKVPVATAPGTCACGCGNALPPQTGRGARRIYIEGHRQAMMLAGKMPVISTEATVTPSPTETPDATVPGASHDANPVKIDNMSITVVKVEGTDSKKNKDAIFYKMPWSTLPVRGIPGFAPGDVVQRNSVTGKVDNFEHSTTTSYLVVKIEGQKALALWLPSETVVVEKAAIDTSATNEGKAA